MVPQVSHFLLVFDRAHSRLLSEQPFEDHRKALEQRFQAERMHRGNPDIEVVVLSAESRAALRMTHARYFESMSSLASRSASARRTAAGRIGRDSRNE